MKYYLSILDIKMPKMDGFEFYNEIMKIDDKVKILFSYRWRDKL